MFAVDLSSGFIYKYMRQQHAIALLEAGRIRIGTLYEYQDIEKYGRVIGDDKEGTKVVYTGVNDLEVASQNDIPDFMRKAIRVPEGVKARFRNVTLEKEEYSPNYYIFCASEKYDPNLMQYLGYDICVKIKEPKEFLRALTWCLRHKANFVGFHRCVYIDRRVLPTDQHDIHPAIIKDPVYEHQEEVRAIWESKGGGIEPFIIRCRRVAQYCSIAEQI